jgi:hypothetical protein
MNASYFYLAVIFVALTATAIIVITTKKVKLLRESKEHFHDLIEKAKIELNTITVKLEKSSKSLIMNEEKLIRLEKLESEEMNFRNDLNLMKEDKLSLENEIEKFKLEKETLDAELADIKSAILLFSPSSDMISYGIYDEPTFLFDTSQKFADEIKSLREQQKKLIREGFSVDTPDSIAIIPDNTLAVKTIKNQAKLMIRAFNIECDSLISMIKTSNYQNILERIEKIATEMEKLSVTFACGFTEEYINLKLRECLLMYQFRLKQQREKEEQDRIKEEMREEQKALREYERALEKAKKEEQDYRDAIEVAKRELEISVGNEEERIKLMNRIEILEERLKAAEESERRALSMAEQTKVGHVYIISNIGSFGEDVYKIGLTRRLDPLERVKELGDASVPFAFDVHAMIFSENAPMLEAKLHREFNERRLNMVNQRKEFFAVNLLEIQEKVKDVTGTDANFIVTALAEEYYESLKIRNMVA